MQRKPEMLQRKLIDHLEKVAEEMVEYVADFQHKEAVAGIIQQVEKEYQLVYGSYLLGWASRVLGYRVRQGDVSVLIATVNQMRNSFILLDGIATLFKSGGWDTTSVNTHVAFAILGKLPAYQNSDPDLFAALPNLDIRKRLGELFIDRARSHKLCDRFLSEKQEATQKELLTFTAEHKPTRDKSAYESLLLARVKADKAVEQVKASKEPLMRGTRLDKTKIENLDKSLGRTLLLQQAIVAAKNKKIIPIQEYPFEEPTFLPDIECAEPDATPLPTLLTGMSASEEAANIPFAPPPPPVDTGAKADIQPVKKEKARSAPMSYKAALLQGVKPVEIAQTEPSAEAQAPVVEEQKKKARHAYKAELAGSFSANDPRLSMVSSLFGENAKKPDATSKGLAATPGVKSSSPGKWG